MKCSRAYYVLGLGLLAVLVLLAKIKLSDFAMFDLQTRDGLIQRSLDPLLHYKREGDTQCRLVAITVVIRPFHSSFQIRTQIRRVQDLSYDPLYDGTIEAVGESVKWGEPIVDTVSRGLVEEMGLSSDTKYVVLGAEGGMISTSSSDRNDPMFSLSAPYIYVQALQEPQPWCGLGFVALVPELMPATSGDEEVGESRWWDTAELLIKLEDQNQRRQFMSFHYPVFLRVAQDLSNGLLQKRLQAFEEVSANTQ